MTNVNPTGSDLQLQYFLCESKGKYGRPHICYQDNSLTLLILSAHLRAKVSPLGQEVTLPTIYLLDFYPSCWHALLTEVWFLYLPFLGHQNLHWLVCNIIQEDALSKKMLYAFYAQYVLYYNSQSNTVISSWIAHNTQTHSNLTKWLGLVFLHEAEHNQTEDEEGHEGHSSPSHYSQHGHLHPRLQELWREKARVKGIVRHLENNAYSLSYGGKQALFPLCLLPSLTC